MSNAVARVNQEIADFRRQIATQEKSFTAALPTHIPVARFQRVVVTAIQNNPNLLSAPRDQLIRECVKCAQDGLLPDGKEAALVPRGSAKKGNVSVTYQPMIAGIRKKARNSGEISTWDAHVVYESDYFQFQLGDNPQVNHTYDLRKARGGVIGAYSVAVLKDGTKSYEVMPLDKIIEIRDRSDAYRAFKAGYIKSTPWETDFAEMARKTVAKLHAKMLPMSSDLDDLIRRDDDLYADRNIQGTKGVELTVERPAKTLGSRLDQLADESGGHDPETGEIIDGKVEQSEEKTADKKPAEKKADAKAKPNAAGPTESEAKDRGADTRQNGDKARGGDQDVHSDADGAVDDIDAAAAAGREAREKNMARKSMPAKYRNDERLQAAWLDGYDNPADTGDSDEGQGDGA